MLSRFALRRSAEIQTNFVRSLSWGWHRSIPEIPAPTLPDTPMNEKGEFLVPKYEDLPPHPDESERDFVNFPRLKEFPTVPAYRHGFAPETFFKFFYNKTGVTGPYAFTTTFLTFLYSKEFLIIDNELWEGFAFFFIVACLIHKFGDLHTKTSLEQGEKARTFMNALRDGPLSFYNYKIGDEKAIQRYLSYKTIANEAKQENIHLQLESVYRDRLAEAGQAIKNKLDCALALQRTQNRVEQDHMVNWIVRSVKSSITPAQEAATLKKCIADLAAMSK